jgi:hypothetical protein
MNGRFRRKRKGALSADKLAPPEEKSAAGTDGPVDGSKVKISAELMDGADNGSIFRLDPVVIAILLGAIAFIAFIAWQIHRAP